MQHQLGCDTEEKRAPSYSVTQGPEIRNIRGKSCQYAGGQQAEGHETTPPKHKPLTKPTIDTPDDYNLLMVKWERYRDDCLKPPNISASGIALLM